MGNFLLPSDYPIPIGLYLDIPRGELAEFGQYDRDQSYREYSFTFCWTRGDDTWLRCSTSA